MTFPRFFRVKQRFHSDRIDDVAEETRRQMGALLGQSEITPGKTVAITAGSRGIRNIALITKTVVEFFHKIGLKPFLVPAMGSHGGATAKGQIELLEKYGITENAMGCPIRSSMETVVLDSLAMPNGAVMPIHFDRHAAEADCVFLVNRIKPHTRFAGPIESGLSKMLVIGLGKQAGAGIYHGILTVENFDGTIRRIVTKIRDKISLFGGLGIVENAWDETAILHATPSNQIERTDEDLLLKSKERMPRIPFEQIDLLFIDEIGKNISGTGMDSNIVGRKVDDHKAIAGEKPVVRCIAVRGLTPETGGNANGIGMAEFCLSRVLQKMNVEETRINAITANHVSAAMIPLDYETDEQILDAARKTLGFDSTRNMKIVRIRDTLHLETLLCSETMFSEAKQLESLGKIELLETPNENCNFYTFSNVKR